MTDPVGAALGVAGLAGLFTACVQGLNLIQLGCAYAKDYELLQTKFEAQKVRFLIWGKVVGMIEGSPYDTRLDEPTIRPTVRKILNHIQDLFSDERNLSRRYGLRSDGGSLVTSGPIIFAETYRQFQSRLSRTQKQATMLTTTKWAISDRQKFTTLVDDFKDLMDSLDDITRSLQLLSRQEELIKTEVDTISDESSLRLLEQALSPEDQISSAASQRLRMLDSRSSRPETHLTGVRSLSIEDSFQTAPTHITYPRGDGTEIGTDTLYSVSIPQNQRVIIHSPNKSSFQTQRANLSDIWTSENIGLTTVGQALRDIKCADMDHTRTVIQRYNQSCNPDYKRMVLIFENILNTFHTPFVSLAPIGESLLQLVGRVEGPPLSPYQGGIFQMHIAIPEDFPWSPPNCRFLTKIYHPNIDAQGRICLDVLDPQSWRLEMMYLETILISISALLDVPNVDDPLVPEIAAQYLQDRARFDAIARDYTNRFARGRDPVLEVSEIPRTPGSKMRPAWQTTFLKDRLEWVRSCMTTLIEILDCKPQDTAGLDARVPGTYLKLLYQLSAELVTLDEKDECISRFERFTNNDYEVFENFFDACCLEFHSLSTDECWKAAFPDLPTFQSDATRGTGKSTMGIFQSHIPLPRDDFLQPPASISQPSEESRSNREPREHEQSGSADISPRTKQLQQGAREKWNFDISIDLFGGLFGPPSTLRERPGDDSNSTHPRIEELRQLVNHAKLINRLDYENS